VVDGKCARTIKYMMGVLCGLHVVSMEWVNSSRVANYWVDETPFVVCDFHFNEDENVVLASLQRHRDRVSPLFSGLRFYFHGDKLGEFSKADLSRMVETGGGIVVESLESGTIILGDDTLFVICDSSISQAEAESLWSATGRDAIFFVWLFDCVSSLSIRSTRHNHAYKRTFHEDAEIVRFQTQHSPAL